MKTIIGFERDSIGSNYEAGKTYNIQEGDDIYAVGFYASRHCDISETLRISMAVENVDYYLVDINVVVEEPYIVVGDKIEIIKKLTFDECIHYDKTGQWCLEYARRVYDSDVGKLQQAVIEKDKKGYFCLDFACNVEGANINLLQEAVIEKDTDGMLCFQFAKFVYGADYGRLLKAIASKDKNGKVSKLMFLEHMVENEDEYEDDDVF